MTQKTCIQCRRAKPVNKFPKGEGETCIACIANERAEELRLEVEARKQQRLIEQVFPGVKKKREAGTANNKKLNNEAQQRRRAEKAAAKEQARQLLIEAERKVKEERNASEQERELARRILIRRRLLPFIQRFQPNYRAGWVHHDLCRRIENFVEAVEQKKSPRLLIFMPPRHGKSEISSKRAPAWMLGKHPEWEIIAGSYTVSLPLGFSRKIQELLEDKYYQQLFPDTRLNGKNQAAEGWTTTKSGGYVAAGVGGGITGKGADVLIIDDPIKDSLEADSATVRDNIWDWWGTTAKTRLAPGGGVIGILTRWHDDDWAGRLLLQQKELEKEFADLMELVEQRMAQYQPDSEEYEQAQQELASLQEQLQEIDRWEIVSYPAEAEHDEWLFPDGRIVTDDYILATLPKAAYEDMKEHAPQFSSLENFNLYELPKQPLLLRSKGEALHPARFPIGRLRNMKRSMQPRHWSALYQQNPVPEDGIYFTKDMLRYEPSTPPIDEMYLFSAWDLAAGEKQTNDYIVGSVGAVDWQGLLHILEIVRFRSSDPHTTACAILNMYAKYPTLLKIGIEKGALELVLWPDLKREMEKRRVSPTFDHTLRPITDKLVRARPLQGQMQQGLVLFPTLQPWVENATAELLRFPGGIHDDIVDSLSWLARMTTAYSLPPKPGTRTGRMGRQHEKTLEQKLNAYIAQSRRGGGGAMGA